MFVGMTDPGRRNPNQNVKRTDFRKINLRFLQRFSDLRESHRSHAFNEPVRPALSRLAPLRGNAFDPPETLIFQVNVRDKVFAVPSTRLEAVGETAKGIDRHMSRLVGY